jgi:hypothetical protein
MQKTTENSRSELFFPSDLLRLVFFALLAALPFSGQSAGVVSTATEASLDSALAGGGTVTFACSGTITVTNVENIITNTLLDATGYNVTISGGNTSQVFNVSNTANLTLLNLTIANGYTTTNGGAIYNNGDLTVSNCIFSGNSAIGTNGVNGTNGINYPNGGHVGGNAQSGTSAGNAFGGAIYNAGELTVIACLFQTNSAIGGTGGSGGNGGAGANSSGVQDDGFSGYGGNGGIGRGGAIFSINDVLITNCAFNVNTAQGGSGGNGGYSGWPAGDANGGIGGEGSGAGVYVSQNSTIYGTTFSTNNAKGGNGEGGGWYEYNGYNGENGGSSFGGGVCNMGTNATINCTFYKNTVTGGAGGTGGTGTLSQGGHSGNGGAGGTSSGGGLYNSKQTGVTNCTFPSCNAIGGLGGYEGTGGSPGSAGAAQGGDIANGGSSFTLKNSIFAYSTSGANGYGTIIDAGNNISSDKSINLTATSSHQNTNPLLSNLANNGGYTMTCALQSNSPAINAGDDLAAPITDQRGYPRVKTSDIGSFEYGSGIVFLEALGTTASLNGNEFQMLLTGAPNQNYTVQMATNLSSTNWISLFITNNALTNSFLLTDPKATNQQRFYRILIGP